MTQGHIESDYEVFISAKNLDDVGRPTEDRKIAEALWEFLTDQGYRVFFSNVSLEKMGVSAYTKAIDDALDRAQVLVVVCTSGDHADSKWVRYEWDSFLNEIRADIKPNGHVFVYLVDESIRNLPRGLRHTQCVEHGPDGFERLGRFIANAIGRHRVADTAMKPVDPGLAPLAGIPQLAGEWEGEWRRDTRDIIHRGRLSITQTGQRLTAQMQVTFEKLGRSSIVEESLRGLITSRGVVLQGESFEYKEHGSSRAYLLDHFELRLDTNGGTLTGDFYSKKGRGKASFRRILSHTDKMNPSIGSSVEELPRKPDATNGQESNGTPSIEPTLKDRNTSRLRHFPVIAGILIIAGILVIALVVSNSLRDDRHAMHISDESSTHTSEANSANEFGQSNSRASLESLDGKVDKLTASASLVVASSLELDSQIFALNLGLSRLHKVVGMYTDPTTGALILIGTIKLQNPQPTLLLEDLAFCLNWPTGQSQLPFGCTLDLPPKQSNQWSLSVRCFGGAENTHVGLALLQADLALKEYWIGQRINGARIQSSVKGYSSMPRLFEIREVSSDPVAPKLWFETDPSIQVSGDGSLALVKTPGLTVAYEAHTWQEGEFIRSPESRAICRRFSVLFSEHFEEFANEEPSFAWLEQFTSVAALAEWAAKSRALGRISWADHLAAKNCAIPTSVPLVVSRQERKDTLPSGEVVTTVGILAGGVSLDPRGAKIIRGDTESTRTLQRALPPKFSQVQTGTTLEINTPEQKYVGIVLYYPASKALPDLTAQPVTAPGVHEATPK